MDCFPVFFECVCLLYYHLIQISASNVDDTLSIIVNKSVTYCHFNVPFKFPHLNPPPQKKKKKKKRVTLENAMHQVALVPGLFNVYFGCVTKIPLRFLDIAPKTLLILQSVWKHNTITNSVWNVHFFLLIFICAYVCFFLCGCTCLAVR